MGRRERARTQIVKDLTSTHSLHTVRRAPDPIKGPYEALHRKESAEMLMSSRVGEIRKRESPPKMGMGDLQRQENRRQRDQDYAWKMLKAGKGGKGRKKAV